jgi:hypothetical protein
MFQARKGRYRCCDVAALRSRRCRTDTTTSNICRTRSTCSKASESNTQHFAPETCCPRPPAATPKPCRHRESATIWFSRSRVNGSRKATRGDPGACVVLCGRAPPSGVSRCDPRRACRGDVGAWRDASNRVVQVSGAGRVANRAEVATQRPCVLDSGALLRGPDSLPVRDRERRKRQQVLARPRSLSRALM